jgi:hypothetical protein
MAMDAIDPLDALVEHELSLGIKPSRDELRAAVELSAARSSVRAATASSVAALERVAAAGLEEHDRPRAFIEAAHFYALNPDDDARWQHAREMYAESVQIELRRETAMKEASPRGRQCAVALLDCGRWLLAYATWGHAWKDPPEDSVRVWLRTALGGAARALVLTCDESDRERETFAWEFVLRRYYTGGGMIEL